MDLADKVRLIIGNKCESPSQFADEIGIPRSGVSHLLNGRNKPSLDVITRIVHRYPDVGTDWIWDDNKMPVLGAGATGWDTGANSEKKAPKQAFGKPLDLFVHTESVPEPVQQNLSGIPSAASQRKVERILLFFSDGTFEEFGPHG